MRKERVLSDSKNYLISTHEALRRAFRNASGAEQIFINSSLEEIEKAVKQLEILEGMLPIWKKTKDKKLEMTIEE